MHRFTAIVVIILISLCLKIGLKKLRLRSEQRPFMIEHLNPTTPEQYILYGQKIDLNSAPKNDLTVLPGIGPRLAERIVAKRRELGRFSSVDDIEKVWGIGPAKMAKIRHFIDAR